MPGSEQDGQDDGDREPDYRFTLANERTFLAWMRTCLALLAAAVAVDQFTNLGSATFRQLVGIGFAVLAAGGAVGSLERWVATQRAMRSGSHLRRGSLPVVLAVALALLSLAVLIVLVLELAR